MWFCNFEIRINILHTLQVQNYVDTPHNFVYFWSGAVFNSYVIKSQFNFTATHFVAPVCRRSFHASSWKCTNPRPNRNGSPHPTPSRWIQTWRGYCPTSVLNPTTVPVMGTNPLFQHLNHWNNQKQLLLYIVFCFPFLCNSNKCQYKPVKKLKKPALKYKQIADTTFALSGHETDTVVCYSLSWRVL